MADNNDERLKDFPLLNDERVFNEDERRMMLNRIEKGDYESALNVYNKKSGKILTDFGAAAAPLILGGISGAAVGRAGITALGRTAIGESAAGAIEAGGSLLKKGTEIAVPVLKQGYSKLKDVFKRNPEKELKNSTDKVGKAAKEKLQKEKTKDSSISGEMGKQQRAKKGAGTLDEGYVLKEVIDEIGDFFSSGNANGDNNIVFEDSDLMTGDDGNRSIIPYAQGNMIDSSALFPQVPTMEGQFIGRDSSAAAGIGSSNKSDFILQQILEQLKEIKSLNFSMLSTLNRLVSLQSKFDGIMQMMMAQQKNTERTDVPRQVSNNGSTSSFSRMFNSPITQGLAGLGLMGGAASLAAAANDFTQNLGFSPFSMDNNGKSTEQGFGSGVNKSYSPFIVDKAIPESDDKAKQAMQILINKGWSKDQAAGIVANLKAESNFKINAKGDGGKAYGIAQWHPDRQQLFKSITGKDIRNSTFEEQVTFLDWELRNTEKKAGNAILKTKTAEEAAAVTEQKYERSALGSKGLVQPERVAYSRRYRDMDIELPKQKEQAGPTVEKAFKEASKNYVSTPETLPGGPTKENAELLKPNLNDSNKQNIDTSLSSVLPTKQNAELLKPNLNYSTKENAEKLSSVSPTKQNAEKLSSVSPTKQNAEKLNILSPIKENVEKVNTVATAERIPTDTSMTAKLTPQTQILQNSNEIATASNNKEMNNILQVALSSANKPQQVISPQYPRMDTPTKSVQTNIPDPRNITNGPLIDILRTQFV